MDTVCRQSSRNLPQEDALVHPENEDAIVCAACGHSITAPSSRMMMNQSFTHVFANPHGYVFEIGCFSDAPGSRAVSIPSTEFTWFPGYAWQIAVCQACSTHLGWRFTSQSDVFWGFILEKLIFP